MKTSEGSQQNDLQQTDFFGADPEIPVKREQWSTPRARMGAHRPSEWEMNTDHGCTSKNPRVEVFKDIEVSMSSPVDSPVRTSAPPASSVELRLHGPGFGPNCAVPLARFDPESQSLKMSQRCLVEETGSGSVSCWGTWPRSGMLVNGIVYQLPTLAHITNGTGSGSWPTPMAGDSEAEISKEALRKRIKDGRQLALPQTVKIPGWATPTTWDAQLGYTSKGLTGPHADTRKRMLANAVLDGKGIDEVNHDLRLNPRWVEVLMGFPMDHTSIPGMGAGKRDYPELPNVIHYNDQD